MVVGLLITKMQFAVYSLFLLIFVTNLASPASIDDTAICKPGDHPSASGVTICAYWIGDKEGTNEARLVHSKGINISLHGVFPAKVKPLLPHIPYDQFVGQFPKDLDTKHFIDTSSATNYTCCCSQFHEYTKHGSKSGYTYPEWLSSIKTCMGHIASSKEKFESACSPDFCHFNGTVNFVEECFIGKKGAFNGCKKNHPFIYVDL